jgi:hypothetical protein
MEQPSRVECAALHQAKPLPQRQQRENRLLPQETQEVREKAG